MSLLTVVQEVCRRSGIPIPSVVVGSADAQVGQLLGLCNEICEDVLVRGNFAPLVKSTTFVALGTSDQGLLSSLLSGDTLHKILNQTIWNRTTNLPVFGPLSAGEWEAIQASSNLSSFDRYRIFNRHLYMEPAPTAGDVIAFSYVSSSPVLAVDGSTLKESFTADTDTFLLGESVLKAGLRWAWKSEKGLECGEDLRRYESRLAECAATAGTAKTLDMASDCGSAIPGIFVSPGTWDL